MMMKKFLMFFSIVLLLGSIAIPTLAQTSVELNYYDNDLKAECLKDNSREYKGKEDQDGVGVSLEHSFGRFLLGAEYTDLNNDGSEDSEDLYAADQKILNIKCGYRALDRKRFKLDTYLVYNRFKYEVDESGYKGKIEAAAAELKTTFIISPKLTAALAYTRSFSTSTSDNSGSDYEERDYYVFGGELSYNFNDHYSAHLGYKRRKYELDLTYSDDWYYPEKDRITMDGLFVGVKYTF
jgi:predicted porin